MVSLTSKCLLDGVSKGSILHVDPIPWNLPEVRASVVEQAGREMHTDQPARNTLSLGTGTRQYDDLANQTVWFQLHKIANFKTRRITSHMSPWFVMW